MKLTPKHLLLIETLADPLDTRTNVEKAEACGLSESTVYRLLKEPEAIMLLNERTTALVSRGRSEAYQCLMRNIRSGDRASARDYLQATGDIGTGGTVTHVNVTQNAGTEELSDAMERVARNRARVLATEE